MQRMVDNAPVAVPLVSAHQAILSSPAHSQGPIGTIIIFRQCVSHIFYKKAIRYYQKATFL